MPLPSWRSKMRLSVSTTPAGMPSVTAMSPEISQWISASGTISECICALIGGRRCAIIASREATSSPSRSAKPLALAVQPDQRSIAAARAWFCASAPAPASAASQPARQAVRRE